MRLPNMYICFEKSEDRIMFVYDLLGVQLDDWKTKKAMQKYLGRLENGTKSSPYYDAFRFGGSAEGGRAYWQPSETYRAGIRRLYYPWKVRGQFGYWLALQLEGNNVGKYRFAWIHERVSPDQLIIFGKIPNDVQAEIRLRKAEALTEQHLSDVLPERSVLHCVQRLLDEALALDPSRFEGDRVYLWEKLAFQWAGAGKLKNCEYCFRKQSQLQPGNGGPFLNLGFIYYQEGMRTKAISAYLEGLGQNPQDEYLLHNLAMIYMELESSARAFSLVNDAILNNPSLPSIYKLKGDLMLDLIVDTDYTDETTTIGGLCQR